MRSGDPVIARDRVISGCGDLLAKCHGGASGQPALSSASPRLRGEHYFAAARSLLRFVWTLVAVFRELFDESAYERFLQRTCAPRSTESYHAFLRDREEVVERRPRCC